MRPVYRVLLIHRDTWIGIAISTRFSSLPRTKSASVFLTCQAEKACALCELLYGFLIGLLYFCGEILLDFRFCDLSYLISRLPLLSVRCNGAASIQVAMAEDDVNLRKQFEMFKGVEQHKNIMIEVSTCTIHEPGLNSS